METEKANSLSSSKKPGEILCDLIKKVRLRLNKISNEESGHKPFPDKWSQKEILGHLIDSASVNHQRFVRARFQSELVFSGYDQDKWVTAQNYNSRDWDDLVNLWYYLNLHLSGVMNSLPETILNLKQSKHNLNEVAWKPVPLDQNTTLNYFLLDYIKHLEHHLDQLFHIQKTKS